METLALVFLIAAVLLSAVVVFKILAMPVKFVFKLLLNALSGFILLLLANLVSGFFDFAIPMNLISCVTAGIFGIPGVAFIILIKLLFL